MTTKFVDYCARIKFPCAGASVQDVILCIATPELLAPTECPGTDVGEYTSPYLPATICQFYTPGEGCGCGTWYYTFSYDDALLADIEAPITSGDITGVFCLDCLTSYLTDKAGDEVFVRTEDDDSQTLVSQHGCEYPLVSGGGGGTLLYGQSVIPTGSYYNLTTSWANIGLNVALPEAGDYLINFTLIWHGGVSEGSCPPYMKVRLNNTTTAVVVPYSESVQGNFEDVTGTQREWDCYTKQQLITVTGATTIDVQARNSEGACGIIGASTAEGTSLITYLKVS